MKKPDYHTHDEYKVRLHKLDQIQALGVSSYPHRFQPTFSVESVVIKYSESDAALGYEDALAGKTPEVTVAGRLMLHRPMGKNIFAQIQEEGSRIQLLFNRDVIHVSGLEGDERAAHKFVEKMFDLGDIIGVRGHLFKTQKGELTVFVKEVTLLSKSLLPLPEKHAGLVDKELRYRKRWLDMIMSPEVLATFKMRSRIFRLIRTYFATHDFMEVETPVLERVYGGAQARPFITHLNSLDMQMYLRIALEISLKKLLVGGINRVFEIGKLMRNEGIDATHNPEFTSVEAYVAYWDYHDMMVFVENLYSFLAMELFGTTKIGVRKDRAGVEHSIDVKTPWVRMTMKESILKYGGIDIETATDADLRDRLKKAGVDGVEKKSRGLLIQATFEEFVERHLIQPHFITDHPIETTPLCKLHRMEEHAKEGIVERFEAFILGMEACNAYSELNDPLLQRELLERQDRLLQEGTEGASPLDEEFIEAVVQGMPPAAGVGIGLDRLTMVFTGATSIRDVIFFPMMRPN